MTFSRRSLLLAGVTLLAAGAGAAQTVTVRDTDALRRAVQSAKPGTEVVLAPGTYRGGLFLTNVIGAPGKPVVIRGSDPKDPPRFRGGGIQISQANHIVLQDLDIGELTGNGLNIDDAGSYDTPASDIVLRRVRVSGIDASGNIDGIKLSGVTDFLIEDCVVERWGESGQGIDMVGCHKGRIADTLLRHRPENRTAIGIQGKGGTSDIVIRGCRFEHAGGRALQMGGSTGFAYFRPPLPAERTGPARHAEARNLTAEHCTFIGGDAAVAFVGVDGAVFRNNTIYRPNRWAIRILQETRSPDFVPARKGAFEDNIVVFDRGRWFEGGVNLGPNTAPETFTFARNFWYCRDAPDRSRPTLPAPESDGKYGVEPGFVDEEKGDLRLRPDAPARGRGATLPGSFNRSR